MTVMVVIQFRVPLEQLRAIDRLVKQSVYPNRSEAVRDMVRRDLYRRETRYAS